MLLGSNRAAAVAAAAAEISKQQHQAWSKLMKSYGVT